MFSAIAEDKETLRELYGRYFIEKFKSVHLQ